MSDETPIVELPPVTPERLADAVRSMLQGGAIPALLPAQTALAADAAAAAAERGEPSAARRFQAMIELAYLAASADGLDPAERSALALLLERVTGAVVDRGRFDLHLRDLDEAAGMLGRPQRLARVAADLDPGEREQALGFAALVAMADGRLHPAELDTLVQLGACFDHGAHDVRRIVDRVAGALGDALAGGAR